MSALLIILGLIGIGGGCYGLYQASQLSQNGMGMDANSMIALVKGFGGLEDADLWGRIKIFAIEYRIALIVAGVVILLLSLAIRSNKKED